jgi:hypothetical protein
LKSGVPLSALQRFERAQHGAVHNPLLCLFANAIGILSWGMNQELRAPAATVATYKEHTLHVFAAICARDPIAAANLECASSPPRKCRAQFQSSLAHSSLT